MNNRITALIVLIIFLFWNLWFFSGILYSQGHILPSLLLR